MLLLAARFDFFFSLKIRRKRNSSFFLFPLPYFIFFEMFSKSELLLSTLSSGRRVETRPRPQDLAPNPLSVLLLVLE
jgi:hypothetical protein